MLKALGEDFRRIKVPVYVASCSGRYSISLVSLKFGNYCCTDSL